MKRLTNRILEAIVEMSCRVEAGWPGDYRETENPSREDEAAFEAAIDAGTWAKQELELRRRRKARRAA